MENNEIYMAVRAIQREFGVKKFNIREFGDKVVVDSVSNNVSFVLEGTYNENGVIRYHIVDIVKTNRINDRYFNDIYVFSYPFDKYKVKDLLTIPTNLRKDDFDFYKKEWIVYGDLMRYIYFLRNEIKNYYKESYKYHVLGLKMASVDQFVESIIKTINDYVIDYLRLHIVPSTEELVIKLGLENMKSTRFVSSIEYIIDFYIHNMGLKRAYDSKKLVPVQEEDRVDVQKVINLVLEKNREKTLPKEGPEMTL